MKTNYPNIQEERKTTNYSLKEWGKTQHIKEKLWCGQIHRQKDKIDEVMSQTGIIPSPLQPITGLTLIINKIVLQKNTTKSYKNYSNQHNKLINVTTIH